MRLAESTDQKNHRQAVICREINAIYGLIREGGMAMSQPLAYDRPHYLRIDCILNGFAEAQTGPGHLSLGRLLHSRTTSSRKRIGGKQFNTPILSLRTRHDHLNSYPLRVGMHSRRSLSINQNLPNTQGPACRWTWRASTTFTLPRKATMQRAQDNQLNTGQGCQCT